jgi:hypothetical protein
MPTTLLLQIIGSSVWVSYFTWCILTPTTWHLIDFVNLIFHEAGHAFTIFFPPLITAVSGSLLQVLVPVVLAWYFYQKGELLSMHLLCLWVAQSIASVSVYVRDAIPMNLELLGGDAVTHDWNFILGQLGLLRHSVFIAECLLLIAYTIMTVSIVYIFKHFWTQYQTTLGGDSIKTGE